MSVSPPQWGGTGGRPAGPPSSHVPTLSICPRPGRTDQHDSPTPDWAAPDDYPTPGASIPLVVVDFPRPDPPRPISAIAIPPTPSPCDWPTRRVACHSDRPLRGGGCTVPPDRLPGSARRVAPQLSATSRVTSAHVRGRSAPSTLPSSADLSTPGLRGATRLGFPRQRRAPRALPPTGLPVPSHGPEPSCSHRRDTPSLIIPGHVTPARTSATSRYSPDFLQPRAAQRDRAHLRVPLHSSASRLTGPLSSRPDRLPGPPPRQPGAGLVQTWHANPQRPTGSGLSQPPHPAFGDLR